MNGKVLVTGGAGFIGSSLVRRLLDRDYDVVVIDNLARGLQENLPDHDRIEFVNGDITSTADLEAAMAFGPTLVVHLAALHYIPYCNEHPGETVHVNVNGTQQVLNAASRYGKVEKLVFASTAAVYGPSDEPHAESESMAPIDIYGISKKHGEELVDFFHRQTGIPAVNARLFNVVGPRETNPHLLPDILDQLPATGPLQLGNLVPKRDYIYTDDVSDGLITLMECDLSSASVNIGSGTSYSASELVNAIAELIKTKLAIDSVAERQRTGDRPNLCADNTRLRGLGWQCRNNLADSLEKTLRHYELL